MIVEELEETGQVPTLRSIQRIRVEGLFDAFNYDLRTPEDEDNLLILYGDNGSGKTTILELLFHLISPSTSKGHRAFVGQVSFRRFSVYLTDGWYIHAERESAVIGDYILTFSSPASEEVSLHFNVDTGKFSEGTDNAYISFLRHLNVEVYFLRADRTLKSDSTAQARRSARQGAMQFPHLRSWDEGGRVFVEQEERQALQDAIAKANDHIRRMSSRAVNAGGASANSIYEDVLKKVVFSARSLDVAEESDKSILEFRLRHLAERSAEYSRFRLAPPLVIADLLETIRSAELDDLPLLTSVLGPYLDSVTARLDALEATQKLIASLVEDVNTFFKNKRLKFSLGTGLQIINDKSKILAPNLLSSGEKHLLLMFCHTVVAHGRRTIFIIDEPELSLNVKWQHRIVDRLLDLVKDSPMQFIFATHSIELLSQQLDHTAKLDSEGE